MTLTHGDTTQEVAPQEATDFVRAVLGSGDGLDGQFVALWTAPDRRSHYFPADDPDAIARACVELDASAGVDAVYLGVGLANGPKSGNERFAAADITALTGLWADIDVAGEGHASAKPYPATVEDAVRVAHAMRLPNGTPLPPTVIIHSGGGIQARWVFTEPWCVNDGQDPEAERRRMADLARRWNDTIRLRAHELGAWTVDSVGDLARLLRVPGTTNRKIEGTPRQVTMMEFSGKTYDVSDLADALAEPRDIAALPSGESYAASTAEIRELLSKVDLPAAWKRAQAARLNRFTPDWLQEILELEAENNGGEPGPIARTWEGERPDLKGDESSFDLALSSLLASFELGAERTRLGKLAEAVMCRRLRSNAKVDKVDPARRRDYLARTVALAIRPREAEPADASTTKLLPPISASAADRMRRDFLSGVRSWLHAPDAGPVLVALGAAVTAVETNPDAQPVWVQVVGASSSGKTEAVHLLREVRADHLDDISEAGLLSWSKGKNPKRTGLLSRVRCGLVTFGDFSTLLAGSDRGGRDKVFAALRRIYDGEFGRDVAPMGGSVAEGLRWAGRLTIVSAVTSEIDRQLSFTQALGERWLYVRVPEASRDDQRAAARQARRRDPRTRAASVEQAAELIRAGQARYADTTCSDELMDEIEQAAQVAAWGRASVPRDSYGTRAILDGAVVEGIGRIVQQLATLGRGLLALGLAEFAVAALCRRVALDSMPAKRRKVLTVLADQGESQGSAAIGRAAGLDRKVARLALEDLEAVGVVDHEGGSDEDNAVSLDGRGSNRRWHLNGADGEEIRAVFAAPLRTND